MLPSHQEIIQFGSLELIAKKVVEGFITGLHQSPYHGFSVEFSEHRLYNQGESTKNIDWKLYAKSDKLYVKQYEEETNLRCQILIDQSSSMLFPIDEDRLNKLQFAVVAAASLIELLRKQRDAVGLTLFDQYIHEHLESKSGSAHINHLYSLMDKVYNSQSNNQTTNITETIHQIAESIHKRSLVIVFSDFLLNSSNQTDFDETMDALQHMRHNKHEVIVFHVYDKAKELNFDFENRPYHFIDLESNQEIKLQGNQVKEEYTKIISRQFKALKDQCGEMGVDFVETDINSSIEEVLISFLLKRNKLF